MITVKLSTKTMPYLRLFLFCCIGFLCSCTDLTFDQNELAPAQESLMLNDSLRFRSSMDPSIFDKKIIIIEDIVATEKDTLITTKEGKI